MSAICAFYSVCLRSAWCTAVLCIEARRKEGAMKYIHPDYAGQFQCLAGACRHSCCVGWEIDIDDDTLEFWQAPELNHPVDILGTIDLEETPHFVLTPEERCPHLREDGLCRMILAYGEDVLCDICREHPRFYHEFTDREELGLGMCCEEAARLLVCGTGPVQYIEEDDGEEAEALTSREEKALALRSQGLSLLYAQGQPLRECLSEAADGMGFCMPSITLGAVLDRFADFEFLDPVWPELLRQAQHDAGEKDWTAIPDDLVSRRLLDYFLYRHMAAEEQGPEEAFLFACYSTLLIRCLGETDCSETAEYLRMLSAEIEYSDCNLGDAMTFFHDCFGETAGSGEGG